MHAPSSLALDTATGLVAFSVLLALSSIAGLALASRRPSHPLARLAHPRVLLYGAGGLAMSTAAVQWWTTHRLLRAGFTPTDTGWARIPGLDVATDNALTSLVHIQSVAAVCVGLLVPLACLAAWRCSPDAHRPIRLAQLAAAVAIGLPVVAGSAGVVWVCDLLVATPAADAVWTAWHGLEAAKWAVVGVGAFGMMAATPVVVHAASQGHVVSTKTMQRAQAMLLIGLAAWSTSRFATEDLSRGPLAQLESGRAAWTTPDALARRLEQHATTVTLPTAPACAEEQLDVAQHAVLPLSLDASGFALHDTDAWQQTGAGELVVAGVVDRGAPADAYLPYLERARALGATRVAVLSERVRAEATLTFGELRSASPCVVGWLPLDKAARMSAEPIRWTTVAFHARRVEELR